MTLDISLFSIRGRRWRGLQILK